MRPRGGQGKAGPGNGGKGSSSLRKPRGGVQGRSGCSRGGSQGSIPYLVFNPPITRNQEKSILLSVLNKLSLLTFLE